MDKGKGSVWSKIGKFFKQKGIYAVLMGCLGLVGVAAAFVFAPPEEAPAEPTPTPYSAHAGVGLDEHLDELKTPSVKPSVTPKQTAPQFTATPDFTAAPPTSRPTHSAEAKLPAPVSGEVIWDCAMTELIFSRTLNHWTTHSGIDIAAKLGTEVRAVKGGTVSKVYNDDLLGVTVELTHEGGVKTVYANLQETPPVSVGDKVAAGDVIGCVGKTAASECADKSHLHFEYIINGEWVNPRDHILIAE